MMREGDIIALFAPLAAEETGAFGLRDDAACLHPPADQQLVITTDSVIEGVHVLAGATPQQCAAKLLRRNLSDLAAMGATPWRYTLNLHAPRELDDDWFVQFAQALQREQAQFAITLAGGDTTRGGERVHLTLTALGLVAGAPLTRSGARAGDTLYASGTIGDAALGLAMLQADAVALGPWVERYHYPRPRIALGKALHGIATAALDCSDGLLKDVARLCAASGMGVELQRDAVPLSTDSAALIANAPGTEARDAIWQMILGGGDDYELLFTAPPSAAGDLQNIARFLQLPLTPIGTVSAQAGCYYRSESGLHAFGHEGWEH
jgi:thiamine-monophosphate kinase